MPDKNPDLWTIFLFFLASVSGAVGGCAAGSALGLKRGQILAGQVTAYGFIGVVCGGLSYAFGHHIGHPGDTLSVMGWAMAVGIGVPFVLACHNFGARYAFRVFGVDVEFTMRKRGEERRSEERMQRDDPSN
ncbi:hypothetical protein [Pseudazoarcus pumilus]|uniref:Uncharacterized protein n=1 Tax=Pseudazoarcus pumilus TaxID=2067960 RepID=A0A2I6S806_9RHOO|nr:hypothetical protein [Pseudazoarcus pumilus]AUN95396.1 hypothetical protein C0099_10940 [Pseudazoarcus pumilus]